MPAASAEKTCPPTRKQTLESQIRYWTCSSNSSNPGNHSSTFKFPIPWSCPRLSNPSFVIWVTTCYWLRNIYWTCQSWQCSPILWCCSIHVWRKEFEAPLGSCFWSRSWPRTKWGEGSQGRGAKDAEEAANRADTDLYCAGIEKGRSEEQFVWASAGHGPHCFSPSQSSDQIIQNNSEPPAATMCDASTQLDQSADYVDDMQLLTYWRSDLKKVKSMGLFKSVGYGKWPVIAIPALLLPAPWLRPQTQEFKLISLLHQVIRKTQIFLNSFISP